ncbi:MAG: hypothetical protein K6F48_03470 [Paludibacteraceae bacterium]|nr:hypothetical protein [Paludibacteraceae bacterium]
MRILVHIHLHYHDQVRFFLRRLENITVPFDVVFTLTEDNEQTRQSILREIPTASFLVVKNIGYDVYPFLQAMGRYRLDEYDCILKLHSKNSRESSVSINHLHYKGYEWRDDLVDPLIGSKYCFKNTLRQLLKKNVGMVGSFNLIVNKEEERNRLNTKSLCDDYGITYREDCLFFEGTMFACRPQIIQRILTRPFSESEFSSTCTTGGIGTLAHSMETVFGVMCQEMGYAIKGVHSARTFRKFLLMCLKSIFHKDLRKLFFPMRRGA